MRNLWGELKRRNVTRVAATYAIVAWLLIQVINNVADPLRLPDWSETLVIVLLALGFPVALVLAWAYELTPAGIRPARPRKRQEHFPLPVSDTTLIVLLLAVIGISGYQIYSKQAPEAEQASVEREASIAVLPFASLTTDPEQAYFGEGVSEEILNQLARIEGLRVISRTSSFSFVGQDIEMPQIAERLGVTYILEGSVRQAGNQLRITAQLIDVRTNSHLWSATYDRRMEDIFAIQEDIAGEVTQALRTKLSDVGSAPPVSPPTENLEAFRSFLKGGYLLGQETRESVTRAISLLEEAVDLDPAFLDARALLATNYLTMSLYNGPARPEWEDKARSAATRVLTEDPDNGLALATMGMLNNKPGKWLESRRFLERAYENAGAKTTIYRWYGLHLLGMGYPEDALAVLKKAESIDPLDPNLHNLIARANAPQGNYDESLKHELLAVENGLPVNIANVAVLHMLMGEWGKALALEPQIEALGEPIYGSYPEVVEAYRRGETPEGLLAMAPAAISGETPRSLAFDFLWFGEWDIYLAVAEGEFFHQKTDGADQLFDFWEAFAGPLRKKPEFRQLVADLGLPEYWDEYGWPTEYCRRTAPDDFECS